jgi:hypothetical protein
MKITDLISDVTELFGFIWELGEVQYEPTRGGSKVSLGDAPHVKVVDVAKFEATFPGVILTALNGTSIKVACQAVTRRMKLKNRSVSESDMRAAVANSLRGIKNRGGVVVKTVIRAFGRQFESEEAYMTFGREFLASKGLDAETAEEILLGAMETEEVTDEVTE